MRSFGEFLIDKQLATHAQLVDALIWQQQERIPVVQLILDGGLLTPAQVLQVLDYERAHAVTFEQALLDLKLLGDDQVKGLREQHVESGPHIGQVLVAMGALREEELLEGLNAYQRACKAQEGAA